MTDTLPVLCIRPNGRAVVSLHGKVIQRFVGIAFDTVCRAFVLVNMACGWLEFLVSDTLDDALMEAEYLTSKFR